MGNESKDEELAAILRQQTLKIITVALYLYMKEREHYVCASPFDLHLKDKQSENGITILQPDICLIGKQEKIDKNSYSGTPYITIEIRSTKHNNTYLKYIYKLYESAGVKEYWLIDAVKQQLVKYILGDTGLFMPKIVYTSYSKFRSDLLPGFRINIDDALGTALTHFSAI